MKLTPDRLESYRCRSSMSFNCHADFVGFLRPNPLHYVLFIAIVPYYNVGKRLKFNRKTNESDLNCDTGYAERKRFVHVAAVSGH